MRIEVSEDRDIVFREIYNSVILKSSDETFAICMRDSGFEFKYQDQWYEAKNGKIKKLGEL